MSTHWDLYCRTCDVEAKAFHWNHGDRYLTEISHHLAGIAAFAPHASACEIEMTFPMFSEADIAALMAFATAHHDHDVAPRDEYGGFQDRCQEFWRCSCGASHSCTLPVGHALPHGHAVKVTP